MRNIHLTRHMGLRYSLLTLLEFGNPYKATPSRDLDRWIHDHFFRGDGNAAPHYSTDDKAAEKLRGRLKALYGHRVETGTTRVRATPFFARFESGPSTSTETLADSSALAICRLALVVSSRYDE